jgi:hypothetical protein
VTMPAGENDERSFWSRPAPAALPGENDGSFWSRSAPPPPPACENDDRDFWSRGSGR